MTRMFLLNLFLAMVYVAMTGDLSTLNFVIGFGLGYLMLILYARATGRTSYAGKYLRLIRFAGYFLRILVASNIQVAREIITPGFTMSPRIIRYPVQGLTNTQITTLATAITLTPGTLSADIDEQGHYLYIHCMYCGDREQTVRDLDTLKNRLITEVFEP